MKHFVNNWLILLFWVGISALASAHFAPAHNDKSPGQPTTNSSLSNGAEGQRCNISVDQKHALYAPCSKGLQCAEVKHLGRGTFCVKMDAKCRKEGDRCIAASGKPVLEYLPCCQSKGKVMECVEDEFLGSGKFCKIKSKGRRTQNEKCAGAPNQPFISWIPCETGLECVEDAKMGLGKYCKTVPSSKKNNIPSSPRVTKAPTSTSTKAAEKKNPPGKCAKNWNRCGGDEYHQFQELECCDKVNYECVEAVEDGYWGRRCERKGSQAITIPPRQVTAKVERKCALSWQRCSLDDSETDMECCEEGYSCTVTVERGYYGKRCEPVKK